MNKNIQAAIIAVATVMSVPAMAAGNTAQVVIDGIVIDDTESCNITPGGAITSNTVRLDDIRANELEKLAVNAPSMTFAKDVFYTIQDCKTGGRNFTGNLTVSMSGNFNAAMDNVLVNEITTNPARNATITLVNYDNSRIKLDGSSTKTVAFTPGAPTLVRYKATYVKTANGVTAGDIKGTSVFTISY